VPGRLLKEYRREWRHRRSGLLKSWSQTEYYDLTQHAQDTLYRKTPQGGVTLKFRRGCLSFYLR
jgi:hypothetical protein